MTFTPRSKRNTTRLVSVLIAAGIVFAALIFFFYPVSHAQSVNLPPQPLIQSSRRRLRCRFLIKTRNPTRLLPRS